MKKNKIFSAGLLAAGLLLNNGIYNPSKAEEISFIDNVKPYLEFRPRYEFVDVKNSLNKNANALTVRTVIGAKINKILNIKGLTAQLEALDVSAVIDNYSPQKSGYETVPDPDNTRLSQAFVSYSYGNYTFIGGRKYVIIDDHRFIGNVGWRQMPQSFGILAVTGKPTKNLDFLLAGVYERKGIVDSLNIDWKLDKMPIVLDVNYKVIPALKIKGFAYLLTDIHNTYGVKASGDYSISENTKISYLGEYAKQTDPYTKDNATTKPDIDTSYYRLKIGASVKGIFGNIMYTHFGDKNGKTAGFSTPLATLHKFDGWSDVLLKGAANGFDYGLNEICLSAGYKDKNIGKVMVAYLLFKADKNQTQTGSKDIGSEIDALYAKKLTKKLSFLTKVAFYNADKGYVTGGGVNGTKDVTKLWIQLDYKY